MGVKGSIIIISNRFCNSPWRVNRSRCGKPYEDMWFRKGIHTQKTTIKLIPTIMAKDRHGTS
jgi:hypothetical protein